MQFDRYGSDSSRREYERICAEVLAGGLPAGHRLSIAEVLVAFLEHARAYYLDRDGQPSSECRHFAEALRPVARLYSDLPACEFGPLALRAVSEEMVRHGWCRGMINQQVQRVRRVFGRPTESIEMGIQQTPAPATVIPVFDADEVLVLERLRVKLTGPEVVVAGDGN